jgi:hypothetical protein
VNITRKTPFSIDQVFGGIATIPILAKLHGSVEEGDIIPPTWNKNLHPNIMHTWNNAYQALSEANHIRIIGYSLPVTDSYLKYLFKSAVVKSKHLKRIDVLCLDPDGSVKSRYDDFIRFHNYRFKASSVEEYLDLLHGYTEKKNSSEPVSCVQLENAHNDFFK